jgi:peptide/nickel transport system permease protein
MECETVIGEIAEEPVQIIVGTPETEKRARWRSPVLRRLVKSRLGLVGVSIIVFMTLFSFLGPLFYHTDQIHTNLIISNEHPSASHLLGTDPVGYDVMGRLMIAGRSSLEVGVAAALLGTLFGSLWGTISGFYGGVVDAFMMRVVDAIRSLPALLILLVVASAFTPGLVTLIIIFALLSWLVPARLLRGESLTLKFREYVEAAQSMGATNRRIMTRHILPNAIGTVIVNTTFLAADAILALAALSFLGLGIPPPATDWGGMLSNGVDYVADGRWWLIYPPGLAIVAVVVGFNLIGDALRESQDVRLRRG